VPLDDEVNSGLVDEQLSFEGAAANVKHGTMRKDKTRQNRV